MSKNRPPKFILQELGKILKGIREKKGMSQADVAYKADRMSPNYFAKIERGEINMSLGTLYKVVKGLGIKARDIIPF